MGATACHDRAHPWRAATLRPNRSRIGTLPGNDCDLISACEVRVQPCNPAGSIGNFARGVTHRTARCMRGRDLVSLVA
jgi:hypothetical protein